MNIPGNKLNMVAPQDRKNKIKNKIDSPQILQIIFYKQSSKSKSVPNNKLQASDSPTCCCCF